MHALSYRFRSWRIRAVEKAVLATLFRLPDRVKDRVWLHRTGELTSTRALECQEVPAATVQQLMDAMKDPNTPIHA